jgi:predicted Rossmann-fold nucleotide-binding protein
MTDVQELIVTRDMHERKQLMFERSDAFVAMPGGVGTLEELVEQMTWAQLGRHNKPILLGNIDGFWEPFLALINHMRERPSSAPGLSVDVLTADRVEDMLPKLRAAAADVGPNRDIATRPHRRRTLSLGAERGLSRSGRRAGFHQLVDDRIHQRLE